jgi:hypothetical protein
MENQSGATAPRGSTCPEKALTLVLGEHHFPQLRLTRELFRRLRSMTSASPEWRATYQQWQLACEDLTVMVVLRLPEQEDWA